MPSHPDYDLLLSLEDAAPASALPAVRHIADCRECCDTLHELDVLAQYRVATAPDQGFNARILDSLAQARSAEVNPRLLKEGGSQRPAHHWGFAIMLFAACSVSSWVLLYLGSWSQAVTPDGWSALRAAAIAVIAGLAVASHTLRSARPQQTLRN
ncbi:MAG: hypothetical protein JWM95_1483 [Gemmatimonadetes bacterium]|nr:hypothetical protein [Gemmatimonadota bacterium]